MVSHKASPGQNRYSGSSVSSSSGPPGTRGLALSGWPRCHHGVLAQAGRGIGFCGWLEQIPIQAASHTPPPPGLRQPQPGKVLGLRTGRGWEVVSVDVMFVITQTRLEKRSACRVPGSRGHFLAGFWTDRSCLSAFLEFGSLLHFTLCSIFLMERPVADNRLPGNNRKSGQFFSFCQV